MNRAAPLNLPRSLLSQIETESIRAYPEECCGILLGHDEPDSSRTIDRILPIPNDADPAERHHRYTIAPQHLFQAEQSAKSAGLQIVGIYHSHPDHPAEPSARDRQQAWPFYSYIIASVSNRTVTAITAWRFDPGSDSFAPQQIVTENEPNQIHARSFAQEQTTHAS